MRMRIEDARKQLADYEKELGGLQLGLAADRELANYIKFRMSELKEAIAAFEAKDKDT